MRKVICFVLLCLICSSPCIRTATATDTDAVPTVQEPTAVDLDLSRLSGTVVYAQVYNLMVDYESWIGKVIKIAGYYSAYEDTERGVVYHACVIPDATACCAQGMEFVWAGEHLWPDDFPEDGTDILVTGRLEIYEEDGSAYLHLVDAELTWEVAP